MTNKLNSLLNNYFFLNRKFEKNHFLISPPPLIYPKKFNNYFPKFVFLKPVES